MLMTILILMFTVPVFAPAGQTIFYIEQPEAIRPYEAIWQATCLVESNFNDSAIGDQHLKEWSYGRAQIRRSLLDDYFEQTGILYSVTDMFDPVKAKRVFMHYASKYDPWDIESIARCWNGGEKGMNKPATLNYYLKIKKVMLSL